MTATEFRTVQDTLGLSDEALAAELALTPTVVRAWRTGSVPVPERHARLLRWQAAIAARQAVAEASGLPACEWVQAWEDGPVPDEPDVMRRHLEALNVHGESCPICLERARYVEERCGPMPQPPSPAGVVRVVGLLERVPSWGRPAVVGAAILGAIVGLRVLFALPTVASQPRKLVEALTALVAAMGAGAAGGLAYSLTRPMLRRLGRPGDYLTGVVCVFAYMGAIALVAPIAFGERVIKNRADLVVFGIVSAFFGLVVGHSWFRKDALG